MRLDRLDTLINLMQRVANRGDAFDIGSWQETDDPNDIMQTEDELHTCGMPACLGGWLAVSPEFQADGGLVGHDGEPVFCTNDQTETRGARAFNNWLRCGTPLAKIITNTSDDEEQTTNFYGVDCLENITPFIVVQRLTQLKEEYTQ